MNVVYHGHTKRFKYDYYGIHPGTEDRLTFFGPADKEIRAEFIDCRKGSPTWGCYLAVNIAPSMTNRLCIPPGVAHIFDGLEDVYTLNEYEMYLPDPVEWASAILDFKAMVETINVRRGCARSELPEVKCLSRKASGSYYNLVARNIENNLDGIEQAYPLTKEFKFQDGTSAVIRLTKRPTASTIPKFEPLEGREGIGWHRKFFVTGGDETEGGFFVVRPGGHCRFVQMDANGTPYVSAKEGSAFERRVTILGVSSRKVKVRIGANGDNVCLTVSPSPFRELSVPVGWDYQIEGAQEMLVLEQSLGFSGYALEHRVGLQEGTSLAGGKVLRKAD